MYFGAVPVQDAQGALLAHTLRLPAATLRKGVLLGPDEIGVLVSAGLDSVMVARLEEGDVHEDQAAAELARAVAGTGVRAGRASAGRCNLFAHGDGLVVLEQARIDELNGVHESLTLATLPWFRRVVGGELVGTIKVIPFAAPREALDVCTALAARDLVRVTPFRSFGAALVSTTLPGTREESLDQAEVILARRLAPLGGRLELVRRVAHETEAVARALGEALDGGSAPVFLLGASASVDRGDVIPSAIVRSGGVVERMGIPVDPGNLLLLGRRGGATIVGMPGCARSPRPSGFDRVLERLAAGLTLDGAMLVRLGVGGLMKEIVSRPHPREEHGADAPRRIGALVLGAGRSSRMGVNKLVQTIEGKPLIARVVAAAVEAGAQPVVVVTGYDAPALAAALEGRPLERVHNPRWQEGMSTSLAAGILALEGRVDAALVCLGDMPRVNADDLGALVQAFERGGGNGAAWVPVHEGKRGNPVLWSARWFGRLRRLEGDKGARALLAELDEEVVEVVVPGAGVLLDVDTREALARARGEPPRPTVERS